MTLLTQDLDDAEQNVRWNLIAISAKVTENGELLPWLCAQAGELSREW